MALRSEKQCRRVARPAAKVHPVRMPAPHPTQIRVQQTEDGVITYDVALSPAALPPVSAVAIDSAWDSARTAAIAEIWGPPRLFRFEHRGAPACVLALTDVDAACWAGAIDADVGLDTQHGLSLCLRLLALIDLLSRARWAAAKIALARDGARIPQDLLHLAARHPLNAEARFDEASFRAASTQPLPAPPSGADASVAPLLPRHRSGARP